MLLIESEVGAREHERIHGEVSDEPKLKQDDGVIRSERESIKNNSGRFRACWLPSEKLRSKSRPLGCLTQELTPT